MKAAERASLVGGLEDFVQQLRVSTLILDNALGGLIVAEGCGI